MSTGIARQWRSLSQDVYRQVGKDFGADGVEITAHMLCAEDHLPYQGRQYSNREFEIIQSSLRRPFGMWNCKHSRRPTILGVSEPAYSPEELEQYQKFSREKVEIDGETRTRYEWSQEQRRIETAIRKEKDAAILAQSSGDPVLRRELQQKINSLNTRYTRVSEAAGLEPRNDRKFVEGVRPVKVPEAKAVLEVGKEDAGILKMFRAPGNPDLQKGEKAPGELARIVEKRYNSADDDAKAVYDKYIPKGRAIKDGNFGGIAHYSVKEKDVFMSFLEDINNPRGEGTTRFHEHGHYLDNAAKVNGIRPSENSDFLKAIKRDVSEYEKIIQASGRYENLRQAHAAIGRELRALGDVSCSVQDIFGCVYGAPYLNTK